MHCRKIIYKGEDVSNDENNKGSTGTYSFHLKSSSFALTFSADWIRTGFAFCFLTVWINRSTSRYEAWIFSDIFTSFARVFNASCVPWLNKLDMVPREKSHHLFAISSLSILRSIHIILVISNLLVTRSWKVRRSPVRWYFLMAYLELYLSSP